MKHAVGVAATTCSYKDWYGTDLIIFFGANPANDQPVTTKYLHEAKALGTKVEFSEGYVRTKAPQLIGGNVFLGGRQGPTVLGTANVMMAAALAEAPVVEAQHREAALGEHVEQLIGDLIVHRAAELRMRMQHQRDRGVFLRRRMIPTLDPAGRPREDDFRHA